MKSIKSFIKSAFSDERGNVSHKRIIAMLCFIILSFVLIFKLFCVNCQESDANIVDGLIVICCVAMGATSFDKFSKREVSNKNINDQE